ncbi:lipoprotein [Streptomyces spinoverrucosus]|uniref:Lipoprotein n=1 Tax=Streptomyces spinoverrucosus TaxID=284043 RepID=A0A4Y3VHQ8_9ACTN|nr:lipoprotein [Streptomyces spinoverrucosus]GHB83171.1 lipoprotein [Streptomyces spinoverrucosus]
MRMGATVAVSALSLALITGCGGESDTSNDSKDTESSSSPTQAAAKALSAAELEKLLLAQGEVKGYKVTSGDDTLPKSKTEVKTDKAECDPLAWATAALAPGDTDANASNNVAEDKASTATAQPEDIADAFNINMTFVGLSSYEGDGAEKAMKAVSDGVSACSGGYGLATGGENSKVTKVASVKGSGLGDESVAFAEDVDMDGEGTATFHTEVVRKGNTIATFYTVNFAALGTGEVAEIPAAVVEAQVAKLK